MVPTFPQARLTRFEASPRGYPPLEITPSGVVVEKRSEHMAGWIKVWVAGAAVVAASVGAAAAVEATDAGRPRAFYVIWCC